MGCTWTPWNSVGQNTGVSRLSLLQGIFPTQRMNPGLPHCRQILYQLSHRGSPRILEWVAYPFSRGSSPPRNQTGVSWVAGGFFSNRAIREAPAFRGHPHSWALGPFLHFHSETLQTRPLSSSSLFSLRFSHLHLIKMLVVISARLRQSWKISLTSQQLTMDFNHIC